MGHSGQVPAHPARRFRTRPKPGAEIRLSDAVAGIGGLYRGIVGSILTGRIRFLFFGRNHVQWDALYNDPSWHDYWSQHLLAGLGEEDAREFLTKHSTWLRDHGAAEVADAIQSHAAEILHAADESKGNERRIYPYYLDLAVDIVWRATQEKRLPDFGETPGDLQDRFVRNLKTNEIHLLKILALAETFDESMFDALVRDQRVAGYAVGTFATSVVEGRSYVSPADTGTFRFHRLMESYLHEEWLKSDAEREQGRVAVGWLLAHLESRFEGRERKDWDESCIELWRRGVEIIITQGSEGDLIDLQQSHNLLLAEEPWLSDFPVPLVLQVDSVKRHSNSLVNRLGSDHPDTLSSFCCLGTLLNESGDLDGAEPLYRRALEGREKLFGLEDPLTINSINNLANLLSGKGDLDGAEDLYRQALDGREKLHGPQHADTLTSVSNLASLLTDKNELDEAEGLCRRALEGRETLLGLEHRDTLASVHNLASLLATKGDLDEAEILYQRSLWGCEKFLGIEHPRTLLSVNCLGSVLNIKGDLDGAEALYRRALLSREKLFGSEHPDTLTSVNSLADVLSDKGDLDGAETLYRRALEGREARLGPEHPDTLISVNSLGGLLLAKGDPEEAEVLCRRSLAGCEKLLGPEHSYTLTALSNLGKLLHDKSNLDEAESLYLQAFQGRVQLFGIEHPDTISSIISLGNILRDKGDLDGAEALYRLVTE